MIKIFAVALLVISVYAEDPATSFAKTDEYQNTVKHVQSIVKAYVEPAIKTYSAPVQTQTPAAQSHYSAPVAVQSAPSYSHNQGQAQSYSSISIGQSNTRHSAPTTTKSYSTPAQNLGQTYSGSSRSLGATAHASYQAAAPAAQASYPSQASHGYSHHEEEYGPAKYEFVYEVEDHHTGDIKSHREIRDGDVVKGEYSLHEPDGTIRTVKYSADKHSGFNAIVEKSGHSKHPQQYSTKSTAPVAKVTPSYHH